MMAKVYEDITFKGTALFHRELLRLPKHKWHEYGKKRRKFHYAQKSVLLLSRDFEHLFQFKLLDAAKLLPVIQHNF